jgi:hypothetical protein
MIVLMIGSRSHHRWAIPVKEPFLAGTQGLRCCFVSYCRRRHQPANSLAAGDGFLPRQLTYRGGRLVFSWGIAGLAAFASMLVIVSHARVTSLVPLYAIGVFLSFTMSQSGMVVRLRKIGKLRPGEEVPGRETVMPRSGG